MGEHSISAEPAPLPDAAGAHPRTPVPIAETVSGFQVGLVCVGIAITLPALYTGGEIARGLGLAEGMVAVVAAALLLSVMSVPSGIVGVRTRLTSYMIIEHVFGPGGARIVNAAFGVVLLGWYAVTAELFGRSLAIASADLGGPALPQWCWTVGSSALVIFTTVYGFRALDRLALVAVPLLTLVLAGIVVASLGDATLGSLLAIEGHGMAFTEGVSILIGAMIVNVVLMPDLTRFARTDRGAVVAAFVGNGGGIAISTVLAMIPALALGELDPMVWFAVLGVGAMALAVLVFATWTTNGVNLYSTGLVAGSALPRISYGRIVVGAGIFGTALAIIGVADRLTDFLIVLGLIVPPVAGVYLTRFFLLGEQDFTRAHLDRVPAFDLRALGAAGVAGGISAGSWFSGLELTGLPSIEALLLAAGLTLLLDRGRRPTQRTNEAAA